MYFLRIAVMNNNASLSFFISEYVITIHSLFRKRTFLSLASNFVGFFVNLCGLLFLSFLPSDVPDDTWGIDRELWWVLVFSFVAGAFTVPTFLSPRDSATSSSDIKVRASPTSLIPKEMKQRQSLFLVMKKSIMRIMNTFYEIRLYKSVALFLTAYMFSSPAGAAFAIFLSSFFLKIYNVLIM